MKKNIMKKIASLSIISLFSVQMMYVLIEPTVVTAATASDNVIVTLNVDSGISITNGADATMAPNIGIVSDRSIGSSSWNVKTSSVTGYTLGVKASTTPALKNGATDNFADYTQAAGGGTLPDVWGGVASGDKEFGFSGYGDDVPVGTWGSYSSCGTAGVPDASAKYFGFTTSDKILATKSSITGVSGNDTFICFAAQQVGTYAISGAYTATITATATTI